MKNICLFIIVSVLFFGMVNNVFSQSQCINKSVSYYTSDEARDNAHDSGPGTKLYCGLCSTACSNCDYLPYNTYYCLRITGDYYTGTYSGFGLLGYQEKFTLDLSIFSIFSRTEARNDLFH